MSDYCVGCLTAAGDDRLLVEYTPPAAPPMLVRSAGQLVDLVEAHGIESQRALKIQHSARYGAKAVTVLQGVPLCAGHVEDQAADAKLLARAWGGGRV